MKKNDLITVTIEGYTSEGAGVAHPEGMATFIPGTLKGETCEVRILKVAKTVAYGKLERVITPSPARVVPDCAVYPKCGGCALRHMNYAEELRYKESRVRDALARIAGIAWGTPDAPVWDGIDGAADTDGCRNKAQFPVGGVPGHAVTGFYRANSHDIVATDMCRLQTPEANACVKAVREWMNAHRIAPYEEKNASGLVRHIFTRTAQCDRRTVVTLVVTRDKIPEARDLLDRLQKACPAVSGVVLNVNAARTNVILGNKYRTLWGDDTLTDTLGGLTFAIRPASFYQVNPAQAEVLYSRARAYLLDGGFHPALLLDLYCGTGTIGLYCANACGHVTGVEVVEQAVEDARGNAVRNGIANADFLCGDAGTVARTLRSDGIVPDAVVVDPPRKGLDETAAATILEIAPQRVVYVSCDPATLARDIGRLSHMYRLTRARAVDMFPRTAHVETVVLMSRVEGK